MTDERLAELMVKVTDEVASSAEREELMNHLVDRPELRKELEAHMAMRAVTKGWVERLTYDVALDKDQAGSLSRLERGLGASLIVVSLAVLVSGALVEVFLDPTAPLWLKFGLGMLGVGTLVLAGGAVRWRMSTAKEDEYTEVMR